MKSKIKRSSKKAILKGLWHFLHPLEFWSEIQQIEIDEITRMPVPTDYFRFFIKKCTNRGVLCQALSGYGSQDILLVTNSIQDLYRKLLLLS